MTSPVTSPVPTLPMGPSSTPGHVAVRIDCAHCHAGNVVHARVLDGDRLQPDPWAVAVAQGFRVEPRSCRVACGPSCAAALANASDALLYTIDASRDPHDVRLHWPESAYRPDGPRQPIPVAPVAASPEGARPIVIRASCAHCAAATTIHAYAGSDGSITPDPTSVLSHLGWRSRDGRRYCGEHCMRMACSALRRTGEDPALLPRQPVPVTTPIVARTPRRAAK